MYWNYSTTQGETWDIVARRIYGTETLASHLQQANPGYLNLLFFPKGLVLRIPETPDGVTVQPVAPWKRSLILDALPSPVGEILIECGYYGGGGTVAIGTANHDELENRGLSDQHPSGSVTHRERPLDGVLDSMETAVADLQNKSYDHIQEVPSEEWRIVHNLGVRHPLITIFDATGIQTNGAPDWPNATENDVVVHFANALTGTARVVG